ncbi:hypothetical protein B0H13DRAFT_2372312 [Mycena leptocephala]|nr:hypothetical protein B0H13DRAFT_2372312 [Mycena leptocephala]
MFATRATLAAGTASSASSAPYVAPSPSRQVTSTPACILLAEAGLALHQSDTLHARGVTEESMQVLQRFDGARRDAVLA